jgi:hypothetical protein
MRPGEGKEEGKEAGHFSLGEIRYSQEGVIE